MNLTRTTQTVMSAGNKGILPQFGAASHGLGLTGGSRPYAAGGGLSLPVHSQAHPSHSSLPHPAHRHWYGETNSGKIVFFA
jgi:hypothetical protein